MSPRKKLGLDHRLVRLVVRYRSEERLLAATLPRNAVGSRATRAQTVIVLRVLCSESELEENGEVIAVGDRVSRLAGRVEGPYYGTDLDSIDWRFDQYAEDIGYEAATISGQVTEISAIYVQRTAAAEGGWTARPGSAHLEPLSTTEATRKIVDLIDWGPPSPPDEHGRAYSIGHARVEEGDELLSGWVFTLDAPHIHTLTPTA